MTNLASILKSRDITLPTKVHLVKAMVFPVVMYGCESWTVKKNECWRIDFWTVVLEKTVESPLDCKEIQPVHPKGDQSWVFMQLQYFGHLMRRVNSLEKTLMLGGIWGRRRRGWQRMRWHHQLNGLEFEQILGDGEGQGSLVCCSPWDCKGQTRVSEWTRTSQQRHNKE